ncbi:MAG: fluoride efflux transporter CrcB [Bacillota bacterium]|nr:fluoride efflux transporter CrcB [Bacillota bacterium]
MNYLYVALGGAVGAAGRYLLSQIKLTESFPLTTMVINILGAIIIGAVSYLPTLWGSINPHLNIFLTVGLCGGFTTFSTFSLETVRLLESDRLAMALAYIICSVVLCIIGIYLGRGAVKLFLS